MPMLFLKMPSYSVMLVNMIRMYSSTSWVNSLKISTFMLLLSLRGLNSIKKTSIDSEKVIRMDSCSIGYFSRMKRTKTNTILLTKKIETWNSAISLFYRLGWSNLTPSKRVPYLLWKLSDSH